MGNNLCRPNPAKKPMPSKTHFTKPVVKPNLSQNSDIDPPQTEDIEYIQNQDESDAVISGPKFKDNRTFKRIKNINKYFSFVEVLGKGAFGEVSLAIHLAM